MLQAISTFMESRAKRRTANLISNLPESVQKDIGWRWSPARQDQNTGRAIRWDLI